MAGIRGLTSKDYRAIQDYALAKDYKVELSNVAERMIYFTNRKSRKQVKVGLKTIYTELAAGERS